MFEPTRNPRPGLAASNPRSAIRTVCGPCLPGLALSLALGLTALPVLADDDCDVPIERWQSRDAVMQMADRKGWEVQRLKIDDGCYELRGTDAEGRTVEAKIDPETLELVKMKIRDRDRDRDDDRDQPTLSDRQDAEREMRRDAPQSRAAGAATSSDNPLFTPGTAPRGQVE